MYRHMMTHAYYSNAGNNNDDKLTFTCSLFLFFHNIDRSCIGPVFHIVSTEHSACVLHVMVDTGGTQTL